MSKLSDALNALRVFNNHDLLMRFGEARDVAVEYHPRDAGAGGPGVSVFSPRFETHPGGFWYDRGREQFSTFGRTRHEAIRKAKTWASKQYGIEHWAPSPFGGYVGASVRMRAEAAVRAARKKAQEEGR
jgi:hypothetical protein